MVTESFASQLKNAYREYQKLYDRMHRRYLTAKEFSQFKLLEREIELAENLLKATDNEV